MNCWLWMIGLDAHLVIVNLGMRLTMTNKDVDVKKPYSACRYTVFLRLNDLQFFMICQQLSPLNSDNEK